MTKIVRIKGGLGNQLFQYSFARFLQLNGFEVKLDYTACYNGNVSHCSPRIKNFSIALDEASKEEIERACLFKHNHKFATFRYRVSIFLEKKFNKHYYFEKKNGYHDLNNLAKKTYYDGYWHTWKYSYIIKDELTKDLVPSIVVSDKTRETIRRIENEESVFVGIRKGDYNSSKAAIKKYGSFSNNYYLEAMRLICQKKPNAIFYIFTNDVEWCKKNMSFPGFNVCYREKEEQTSDFEELLIMSHCKNAIIVNSTFHWWGAFMMSNPNKTIVCPDKWYADRPNFDICPKEWTKIDRFI